MTKWGRPVILIHGRNLKPSLVQTKLLHNAAEVQKKVKRPGMFWRFLFGKSETLEPIEVNDLLIESLASL